MSSPGDLILIIGALFVLGLLGLLLSMAMYGFKLIKWLGQVLYRALIGQPDQRLQPQNKTPPAPTAQIPMTPDRIMCQRPNCGHVNRTPARFCAVCGCALQNTSPVNAYG